MCSPRFPITELIQWVINVGSKNKLPTLLDATGARKKQCGVRRESVLLISAVFMTFLCSISAFYDMISRSFGDILMQVLLMFD